MQGRDGKLRGFFFAVLCAFSLLLIFVAVELRIDYYDGYLYLLQARRITDPDFSFVPFQGIRPRALVLVFILFDTAYQSLMGHLPGLPAYHVLMAGISIAYILVWTSISRRLIGEAGYLVGILLSISPLYHHYGPMMLADILTGLAWGMTVALFLSLESGHRFFWTAMGAGILGAWTGLGKHHLLPLFPVLALTRFLFYRKWTEWRWTGLALFFYVLGVEILLRVSSGGLAGWRQEIVQTFSGLTSMRQVVEGGYRAPATLYWESILYACGPALLILSALAFVRKRVKLSLSNSSAGAFAATSIAFLVLTQMFPLKEARYLLPFLPAILMPIASVLYPFIFGSSSKSIRIVTTSAFVGALYFPVIHTYQEVRVSLSDPVYRAEDEELAKVYRFLVNASCKEIHACLLSLRPATAFELPGDRYYRSFDIGPHYEFHTKRRTHHTTCAPKSRTTVESQKFREALPKGNCYVVTTDEGPSTAAFLTVFRPGISGWEVGEFFTRPIQSHYSSAN